MEPRNAFAEKVCDASTCVLESYSALLSFVRACMVMGVFFVLIVANQSFSSDQICKWQAQLAQQIKYRASAVHPSQKIVLLNTGPLLPTHGHNTFLM